MAKAIIIPSEKEEGISLAQHIFELQERAALIKEEEDKARALLLENLRRQGVRALHLKDGTVFTISHRETLKAKDPVKAFAWAQENNALKIDTTKATQILRRTLKLPSFFKMEKGDEYLTIKRGKNEGN